MAPFALGELRAQLEVDANLVARLWRNTDNHNDALCATYSALWASLNEARVLTGTALTLLRNAEAS